MHCLPPCTSKPGECTSLALKAPMPTGHREQAGQGSALWNVPMLVDGVAMEATACGSHPPGFAHSMADLKMDIPCKRQPRRPPKRRHAGQAHQSLRVQEPLADCGRTELKHESHTQVVIYPSGCHALQREGGHVERLACIEQTTTPSATVTAQAATRPFAASHQNRRGHCTPSVVAQLPTPPPPPISEQKNPRPLPRCRASPRKRHGKSCMHAALGEGGSLRPG
jgi:hypothetical protein